MNKDCCKSFVFIFVYLFVSFLLLSCASRSDDIPIGFYGPLSGNMAFFGTSVVRGIELGLDEINRSGIHGKRLRLKIEDDRGNPEEAQTAVSRLITRDRVVAILGEPSSSNSLAAAPVCQQQGVPMITPAATNVKVTQVGDYIFRICWIDPFQGEIMARFAMEELKARTVAILYDVGSDYSTGLTQIFRKEVEDLGGRVLLAESFASGDTNFTAQLTNIVAAKPDVLYVPAYYNETGLILRQLRALGSHIQVIGSDGWDASQLLEIGGNALNGSYYCTHFLPSDPDPIVQRFVASCLKRYNVTPSMGEALGYDAILLLADAMRRSSVNEPDKIRNALAITKDFHGVTGRISMDRNRNAKKAALIVKIENKKPQLYKKLEP